MEQGRKLSLAAKCSYLKQDKKPFSEVSRDTDFLTMENSCFPVVQDSHIQEESCELEKSLLEDVLFGCTGTVDSVVHETPIFTLNEQDTTIRTLPPFRRLTPLQQECDFLCRKCELLMKPA